MSAFSLVMRKHWIDNRFKTCMDKPVKGDRVAIWNGSSLGLLLLLSA